ncbi:MAG TPA: MarR family transcriptional regulator [Candidatus Thermoplasmatota archaeon]|jgi:predicted transcriptional regulator|nr:MarR family transcriptional regulator [Candidatus Thermoplasmatota archaeon]
MNPLISPPTAEPTRARVLAAVRAHPGSTVAEVARRVGIDHSTAAYHVARLVRSGTIAAERRRGRVHCFLAGSSTAGERARAIGGRLAKSELVLAALTVHPQPLRRIAAGLPLSKAGVVWHLQRLCELGLAVAEGAPRTRRYRLAPSLAGFTPARAATVAAG